MLHCNLEFSFDCFEILTLQNKCIEFLFVIIFIIIFRHRKSIEYQLEYVLFINKLITTEIKKSFHNKSDITSLEKMYILAQRKI